MKAHTMKSLTELLTKIEEGFTEEVHEENLAKNCSPEDVKPFLIAYNEAIISLADIANYLIKEKL